MLFTVGCASVRSDPPVSPPAVGEAQPATPPSVAKPATPAKPTPTGAAVPTANKTPPKPVPLAVPARVARAPQPAPAPAVAPPTAVTPSKLDLKGLTAQLKATKAIGVFSKLSLKNKVDDLLQQFSEHYEGRAQPSMAELRQFYNLLMIKVLTMVQDDDRPLAAAIVASREPIWTLLSNPKTFATLQS